MASVATISRPDVVARIEVLANRLTGENKTEVVALALRNLEERDARSDSLFGANRGSVVVREGVDLTAPVLDDPMDAEVASYDSLDAASSVLSAASPPAGATS